MDESEEEQKRKTRITRNKQLLTFYTAVLIVTSGLVIFVEAFVVGLVVPQLNKLAPIRLDYGAAAIVLLICAVIGLFLGFFYCCMLQKDDGKVTAMWSILLILFIAEFISACVCFWYLVVGLNVLEEYFTPTVNATDSEYMDSIQMEDECCGYNGPKDYQGISSIPDSCCPDQLCNPHNKPFEEGCGTVYRHRILALSIVTGLFAIVAGVISACGFVGACFLERRPIDLSEPSQQE